MAAVEDRRVDRTKAHDLQDILVLSVPVVLAVLCGTDGWEYIELFADGGGDYVLARNRGQSPRDRVIGTYRTQPTKLLAVRRLSIRLDAWYVLAS